MAESPQPPQSNSADAHKRAIVGIFDRASGDYEQTGVDFFAPIGRRVVERAQPHTGERVLDVGCGRGHCLFLAAERVGSTGYVLGIDLAPRMVEACVEQAKERGLTQVTVQLGDAEAPHVPAGSFDVVTAGLIVFLLPEPARALRNYVTALRPGGRISMSTFGPIDYRYAEVLSVVGQFGSSLPFPSTDDFAKPSGITALLESAGFIDVSVVEETIDFEFVDVHQYWAWLNSHGGRGLVEQIPPDRLAEVQAAAFAVMEHHRTADGRLALRWPVRFTTAATPR